MQSHYDAEFVRDMGCDESQWLSWLPGAVRDHPLKLDHQGASIDIDAGVLELRWHELSPRRIGPVHLPRLNVAFRFVGVDADARQGFMRYFDLYMHRGGG